MCVLFCRQYMKFSYYQILYNLSFLMITFKKILRAAIAKNCKQIALLKSYEIMDYKKKHYLESLTCLIDVKEINKVEMTSLSQLVMLNLDAFICYIFYLVRQLQLASTSKQDDYVSPLPRKKIIKQFQIMGVADPILNIIYKNQL